MFHRTCLHSRRERPAAVVLLNKELCVGDAVACYGRCVLDSKFRQRLPEVAARPAIAENTRPREGDVSLACRRPCYRPKLVQRLLIVLLFEMLLRINSTIIPVLLILQGPGSVSYRNCRLPSDVGRDLPSRLGSDRVSRRLLSLSTPLLYLVLRSWHFVLLVS